MWGERPSPNMALEVGNGSGQLHSWTNPASPGFVCCEDILMPECKYDVLLSKSWYLKVPQSLVYMDHQFCISGAPFITWLRRSNYWDTSTTGPQRRWSSSSSGLCKLRVWRGRIQAQSFYHGRPHLFAHSKEPDASGKNRVFSGFLEVYYKQSRVKGKVYKMSWQCLLSESPCVILAKSLFIST